MDSREKKKACCETAISQARYVRKLLKDRIDSWEAELAEQEEPAVASTQTACEILQDQKAIICLAVDLECGPGA